MREKNLINFLLIHHRYHLRNQFAHIPIGSLHFEWWFGAVIILHRGTLNIILIHFDHDISDFQYMSQHRDKVINILFQIVAL
ncbi:hypothetical protein D3C80_1470670 [compost metagenome]